MDTSKVAEVFIGVFVVFGFLIFVCIPLSVFNKHLPKADLVDLVAFVIGWIIFEAPPRLFRWIWRKNGSS